MMDVKTLWKIEHSTNPDVSYYLHFKSCFISAPNGITQSKFQVPFFPKISTFRECRFATTEDIQINGPQSLQVLSKKKKKI